MGLDQRWVDTPPSPLLVKPLSSREVLEASRKGSPNLATTVQPAWRETVRGFAFSGLFLALLQRPLQGRLYSQQISSRPPLAGDPLQLTCPTQSHSGGESMVYTGFQSDITERHLGFLVSAQERGLSSWGWAGCGIL